ncbi:MAG: hemerythrin family protein [bacterium]|nr:hemerythrin family protein [bacterium]
MPLIEWKEEFSVGNEELDRQHRKWLEFIERLHQVDDADCHDRIVHDILDEMEIYSRYHFWSEERMLEQAGYEDLENHRREHDAMKGRIAAQMNAFRSDTDFDHSRVAEMLWHWLIEHILQSDHRYTAALEDVTAVRD